MSIAGLSVSFTPSSWAWAPSYDSPPAESAPWTCFFSYFPLCQKRCRMSFALVAMTSLAEERHPLGEVAGGDVLNKSVSNTYYPLVGARILKGVLLRDLPRSCPWARRSGL
jgi:hypothetical protein